MALLNSEEVLERLHWRQEGKKEPLPAQKRTK